MDGNGLWQDDRFTEFYLYFVEGISHDEIPIFQIMEPCFDSRNFALDCFGLVGVMEIGDVCLQKLGSDIVGRDGCDLLRKLSEIDLICLDGFGV